MKTFLPSLAGSWIHSENLFLLLIMCMYVYGVGYVHTGMTLCGDQKRVTSPRSGVTGNCDPH